MDSYYAYMTRKQEVLIIFGLCMHNAHTYLNVPLTCCNTSSMEQHALKNVNHCLNTNIYSCMFNVQIYI